MDPIDIVKRVIENGANLHTQNKYGNVAVIRAVAPRQIDIGHNKRFILDILAITVFYEKLDANF